MQTTVVSILLHMTLTERKLTAVEYKWRWRVSKPSRGIEGQVKLNWSQEYEQNPWIFFFFLTARVVDDNMMNKSN